MRNREGRRVIPFFVAVLVATIWGAIVQTQFNLFDLQALGAIVPWSLRAQTTMQDLLNFGPLYAAVVATSFVLAFPVATLISRYWTLSRAFWFALAGLVGLVVAIRVIDSVTPPPVLIAATRTSAGLFAMTAGGALGGWLFAYLSAKRRVRR